MAGEGDLLRDASSESLLRPVAVQPALIDVPVDEGRRFSELEAKGEFTAERFFTQRPVEYALAVKLLAEGWGVIRIGTFLKASPNTIMAVRKREGFPIDIARQELATAAYEGAGLAAEGIKGLLAEWLSNPMKRAAVTVKDLRDLAVIMGIGVQNGQLLAGEATSRVESKELTTPGHEDFNAYIAGLKGAGTSSGGETGQQKEGAPAAPGGVIEVAGVRVADLQSEVKDAERTDNQQ